MESCGIFSRDLILDVFLQKLAIFLNLEQKMGFTCGFLLMNTILYGIEHCLAHHYLMSGNIWS